MWGLQGTIRRLALAAALLGVLPAAAAVERWERLADTVFQHLARDNELPNSAIPMSATQDGEGFLWIGSQNGLARWDGYHFRIYRAEPGKPGALPDNFIQTVLADAFGVLWIGTSSGGLARYDREHDRFVVFPVGPNGLSHVSVRSIVEDGEGGVWVATEGGLDHVLADSSTITHLRHSDGDPGSLPDNRVRGLLRDHRGALWVGTATGLVRLDKGATRLVPVVLPAPQGKVASPWSFLEDSAGRIWVGTIRQGAYVIDPSSGLVRALQESEAASVLENAGVSSLVEVLPGQVWLGTLGQGIIAVDSLTWRTRRIRHDPTQQASLADDSIQGMFKDRAGLIWICSDRSISRYDAAEPAMITVLGASSRADGISDSNVDAILPMPDGRIWLGLEGTGIDIIDPAGTRVAALRPEAQRPQTALPKDYINALAASDTSDVYVGTEQGLYRVDRAARGARRLSIPQRDPTAQVWALLLDADVLWVGGFDGLWALPLRETGTPVLSHAEASQGLTDTRITVIARGARDHLWVGTKNGLNHVNLATHEIERILPEPRNPQALAAGYITSLLRDSRGRLWVATFGGGVNLLESRDAAGRPRFRRFGLAQGLNNDNANMLLEDPRHEIWVSTDDGLAVIDEQSFAIRTFRRAEGVTISSYWVGAGAATAQGEMLFGGIGGMTVVRPERLTRWSYRPPIAITDVRIGGKAVPAGSLGAGASPRALRIPPSANSVTVEFSALDYSAPERNRYAYRLDGFDSGWIESDALHRLASYTNLPPGDYTLRLRGSNRDGVWTDRALSVPIQVLPAWYQTLACRLAAGLAALALVAALVQARTVYLRRSQRDLEQQVVERTAELRESQRQLEQIAYYDTLTALPNRRMFTEEFRELIVLARLQSAGFGLLLIDLDRFKQINDSLGHDAGDALLMEAAIRLQAAVRKSDCVARLGGDEFGVLVTHNPAAADIESICHRIIDGFLMPVKVGGTDVTSSASIGVAVFPDHGATLDSLYKSADLALYEAKRAGGNMWRWYRSQPAGAALTPPVGVR